MYNIIGHRKIWFALSAILVGISLVSFATWGLKYSVDFTGGSMESLSFEKKPSNQEINDIFKALNLEAPSIKTAENNIIVLRYQTVDEETHQKILAALKEKLGNVEEKSFDSIGPVIGQELKSKSITAIILVIVGIAAYVAWAFRKVSKPVDSWKYGVITIIALLHDVIIPIGVFSILGYYQGIEVDASFIAAILTILGYSVNDTIVVFDRTRENLLRYWTKDFTTTVNNSVNETLARSFNTTLTTLFALIAIYLFGGETIKYFALALIIGITTGAYSSVFIASPLLVTWYNLTLKKGK